jgi:3-oxoadipate enol-lactonase
LQTWSDEIMMVYQHPEFKMAYEERGVGKPLLLIHGYPLNRSMWQPQLEGLSSLTRIIAPDLRGFGDSNPMEGIYTMDLLARDCASLLDHLEITQPVVVCGLSMGGYVAMAFARLYPNRMAGLVLTSTRAGADTPETQANRLASAEQVLKEGIKPVVDAMLPKLLAPDTYTKETQLVYRVKSILERTSVAGARGALLGMKERPDSHQSLKHLDLPALVIHGEDDQIIPTSEAQQMHADLKDSWLVILPSSGHLPNLEQPALFNQALQDFLEKL